MKNKLRLALLLMGFTSLVVQVLLIREFLICFYGNELTIGLILGNWIILETIGSSLSSKPSQKNKKPLYFYCLLQCLVALYLPLAIYLIRAVKDFLPLTTGEGVSVIPMLISSFLILAPLSILDGAQFPFGCRIWKDHTKRPTESTGSVYIFEAIGFIIAGPIFTFLFITKLHSFQIALIISLLNLCSGILLVQKESKSILRKSFKVAISALICLSAVMLFSNFSEKINNLSLKRQWKGQNLIESKNSIYGNLAVTKEAEQYTFFSDGIPIITTPVPDIVINEEFIHFGMLAHPNPKDILIIGGGAGGPIAEALKHPIRNIDYAELDPLLISIVNKYSTALTQKELNDPRVDVKITDGARYIKTTKRLYDIIFVNLPPPTTLQLNRFYTKEFFGLTRKILQNDNGILVFKLPGSLSYLNLELRKLNLSILHTLKDVFPHAKVIPGDFNLYLASENDFEISARTFIDRFKNRNIQTRLLTPFHIEYRLQSQWKEWFYKTLAQTPAVQENTSILPVGLFYGLTYWNSLFSPHLSGFFKVVEKINIKLLILSIIYLSLVIFILSIFSSRIKKIGVPYAILTTGMLGMTFDLIIIFIYQSFYGYVYHHIALLITAFMSGLTLGGWLMTKRLSSIKNKRLNFILLETGLIIFALAIIPILTYLQKVTLNFSFIFFILSAVSGFLVGSEFPLANSLYKEKGSSQTAGILYALDLLGSWIGALIVSVALIPVIGLIQTCIFLAVLKLSSLVFISLIKS
ncbi:spermine synthase [Candidatus Omnitrophota bacterium]